MEGLPPFSRRIAPNGQQQPFGVQRNVAGRPVAADGFQVQQELSILVNLLLFKVV